MGFGPTVSQVKAFASQAFIQKAFKSPFQVASVLSFFFVGNVSRVEEVVFRVCIVVCFWWGVIIISLIMSVCHLLIVVSLECRLP
jgi:hypothetical protein